MKKNDIVLLIAEKLNPTGNKEPLIIELMKLSIGALKILSKLLDIDSSRMEQKKVENAPQIGEI